MRHARKGDDNTFYVPSNSNVKIAVYDLNPRGKDVVVLIHGWPLNHKIYEYQIKLLTQNGFRVVTLDLRGFGNSDAPAFDYSYHQLAEDIYHVVRYLHLPMFTLVGFSMGGAIVCRYMGKYLGYGVKKLVLLAAAAPCWTQRTGYPYGVTVQSVNDLIQLASTDRAKLCYNFSRQLLASPHSEEIKNWFENLALSSTGIGTIQTAYSLRDEDCRPDLGKIHVPTGIFHGKKDLIVPYELGELQHREIQGSVLFPFENSGHGIFYDELEAFNTQFLKFLKKELPV